MTPRRTSLASLGKWFALAPDAMLVVDAAGTIVLANELAETMFGYPPGTLAGREVEVLVPEPLRTAHRAHRQHYMASPHTLAVTSERELTGRRANAEHFPIGLSLAPVVTGHGAGVIVSVRDISTTWRARQMEEHAHRDAVVMQIGRLAVSSADYEKALREIPALVADALGVDAIAVFSTDWHRRDPYIRAATGLSNEAAQILTRAFGEVLLLRTTFVADGPDAITTGHLAEPRLAGVRAGLAQAGFRDLAIVPLAGRDEPLGAIAALATQAERFDRGKLEFMRSVANLLAAAAQRNRSEEQLTHVHRLEAIGQLTGGVAHDFNNLLTVISGNLQLLEAELPPDSDAADIIASATRAVDRGASLTHRLLAFARRQPLQPRAVVPKPLLDELGQMLRRTLGEAVSVDVSCEAGVPDVYADANELDTALVNLAINARDAMPRGGRLGIEAREITLADAANPWNLPPARYVSFTVTDTGTGMTPETLARALEPFFTTKTASKGSGLGLSMVYGFASQSGGALKMDSRLGYGTRVELLLPVAAAPVRAPRSGQATAHDERTAGGTLLIVEDEADVRTIATRFLEALGYRVLAAASAEAALDLLAKHRDVDLLFSDIVLGSGMNGIELAHAARQRLPALRVLLTSGYEGGVAAATKAPFPVLHKPYRREQLANAIRDALERAPGHPGTPPRKPRSR